MAAVVAPGVESISQMSNRTKAVVMAGTLLWLFTAAMDQTVVGTSMPRIIADLGGFGLFSWVGTGFMLASTATVPVIGRLTDIYGRKPFYMAGIVTLLLGSALCGRSQNVEELIAFRVIQGLGAGMIMGIAFAVVADVFPPSERGRWMGLMSGVFASASVLGPLIGGALTDHASWRWVFYVNIPLGGVALTVLLMGMPNIRPNRDARLDYRGIVILLATVVPMLLALSWAGSRYDWVSTQVIGLLSWAIAGIGIFTYVELRSNDPLLPMYLFKNRVFLVSALVTLVSGFAMMGSLFYIPLFVQGVIGSSATNSGFVTMPMMIAMAIASAISGQLMSRFGKYRVLGVVGLLIMVGGMYLLSTMDASATLTDARVGMVVFGVGLGTSMPLFMLAVQNVVPYKVMGVSTSTIQFLRGVGGVMGVAVMFSLIQGQYHNGLAQDVPQPVQAQPQLMKAINDPQFLLDKPSYQRLQEAFASFGDAGQGLFNQTIHGVKMSLAGGISDAFFISLFVMLVAVIIGAFMKEVPLRKVHFVGTDNEAVPVIADFASAPSTQGATPALAPVIAGAANGSAAGDVQNARPWLGPAAVAGALCLAVVAIVTFRRR
ncbi:MAG TPA: MDR family MFS transporter, partial [Dehalococcoidia bacterium]|nr:MDR family MFS transporter [Dehalococcoidia bacterium]